MKKALSCKKTVLLIVTILSLLAASLFAFGAKPAFAANVTSPSGSFTTQNVSLAFDNDRLSATVQGGGTLTFKNSLVIDDFELVFDKPTGVSEITFTFTSDSAFAGGVFVDEDEPKTTVENVLTVDFSGKIVFNGIEENVQFGDTVSVAIRTVDGVVTAKVAETQITNTEGALKIAQKDKAIATVKIDFELIEETESATVDFVSVDQMASDENGEYKQTFVLEGEEGSEKIKDVAKPRIVIKDFPFVKDNGAILPVRAYKYTLSFEAYSVFGVIKASDVFVDKDSQDIWTNPVDKPKVVIFDNTDDTTLVLRASGEDNAALETYAVAASVIRDEDDQAPVYVNFDANADLYDNYARLVEKAAKTTYDEDPTEYSIRLGDSYEIPSMENLVTDNYDVYSSLTKTVYYRTPSSATGSTSSMKFTVSEAGVYSFYVAFKDKAGNAMQKEDFYTLNEDGDGYESYGEYFQAVFTFTVEDDAPISVTAPEVQGDGYLNTKYTATGFKIQASGNNVTYTLFYNADANATANSEGWAAIPLLAEISKDYEENGFTYDDIEKMDYDGKYTFTPIKLGAYKIVCNVTSDNRVRSQTAQSVIKVDKEPTRVIVDDHWLQNNVWSVVFLSIGTLALIGIIILLFIKPKEETEKDSTGEALKAKQE